MRNLRLEGRERWNYQTLYKLQNTLLLQIAAVVWGEQQDPWVAGRLFRHCCKLWAPPVGILVLLWGLKQLLSFACWEGRITVLLQLLGGVSFQVICTWLFRLPAAVYLGFCSTARQMGEAGVVWGFRVWIKDYCTAGCAWKAGGEAELEAHSHPLLMIPKEVS